MLKPNEWKVPRKKNLQLKALPCLLSMQEFQGLKKLKDGKEILVIHRKVRWRE